jgi:hypothetical protein
VTPRKFLAEQKYVRSSFLKKGSKKLLLFGLAAASPPPPAGATG